MCTHCCGVRRLGETRKSEVVSVPKEKLPDIISQDVNCFSTPKVLTNTSAKRPVIQASLSRLFGSMDFG